MWQECSLDGRHGGACNHFFTFNFSVITHCLSPALMISVTWVMCGRILRLALGLGQFRCGMCSSEEAE